MLLIPLVYGGFLDVYAQQNYNLTDLFSIKIKYGKGKKEIEDKTQKENQEKQTRS